MPVVVDTGAEVSIPPFNFANSVTSPMQSLPSETREVRCLEGALVRVKEPLPLCIHVCNVTLSLLSVHFILLHFVLLYILRCV